MAGLSPSLTTGGAFPKIIVRCYSALRIVRSVADPHHNDSDLDPDCHFDADPDPDPACHFDADPDPEPVCHIGADPDPDPACYSDGVPDPGS